MSHAELHAITHEQGRKLLDDAARRNLGISGDEFIQQWDAGVFRGERATRRAMRVAMLLPLGRDDK